jgi:hypothetical protein
VVVGQNGNGLPAIMSASTSTLVVERADTAARRERQTRMTAVPRAYEGLRSTAPSARPACPNHVSRLSNPVPVNVAATGTTQRDDLAIGRDMSGGNRRYGYEEKITSPSQ